MTMKTLVNDLYTALQDMDYMDYADTLEDDLKALEDDLELLQKQGNGALLNALKMLLNE